MCYASSLISPGSDIFIYLIDYVVEVHRIHHRATHSLRASKSGGKFWDWSRYRGDSAEFSAEV
ncbi:hypothetical protein Prudu_235S001300 [Prunus dulcis]|uniref:Uncharacterized protein n=1 Tax=Prunus dulcis TaxID=3755 RepID=A0A5H2XLH5_PRUDU|nr:hypothetical protein Prudu_235S001300 [Prunus dulcis]